MRTCVERLIALPLLNVIALRSEIGFLEGALDTLRHNGTISNDAYLDAGAVQGGLAMLANLLDLGVPRKEQQDHLRQLLARASKIGEAHPELDQALESMRQ